MSEAPLQLRLGREAHLSGSVGAVLGLLQEEVRDAVRVLLGHEQQQQRHWQASYKAVKNRTDKTLLHVQ